MATVKDLFQTLPSYWKEHVRGEDQLFIEALFDGFSRSMNDAYRLLYAFDQAKSIRTLKATVERDWFHIDLTYTNATVDLFKFTLEKEIVSIPQLQTLVEGDVNASPGTVLTDAADYIVDSQAHTIEFVSVVAKELVSRDVVLVDSLGSLTPTGVFVGGGGLSGLTGGLDYTLVTAELLRLHSKAAFDLIAALDDGASLGALQDKILWAPSLFTDERLVYQNFGFLLGIAPEDVPVSVEVYKRIVEGLWFIAWNGPTPFNLKLGINVLFDFPVALEAGRIHSIESAGLDVVVTVASEDGVLFDTTIPAIFAPIVAVGDNVIENQPLSDAVEILDELNSPGWYSSLSLARYSQSRQSPKGLTGIEELDLKSRLKNSVFGIRLKDSHADPSITIRSQVLKVVAKFLRQLKPYYAQFAFVDDILFVEVTPDEAAGDDAGLTFKIKKWIHPTLADNPVNRLFDAEHDTSVFFDYDAYEAAASSPSAADEHDYYLSSEAPAGTDELALRVKYPGSGGFFVDIADGAYEAFRDGLLVDVRPPQLLLTPDPGTYYGEISVRVRIDEPCRLLYTLNGIDPKFGAADVGRTLIDRIPLSPGSHQLKLIAKDRAGNISPIYEATYDIALGLPSIRVSPSNTLPIKESVSAVFSHPEQGLKVYYSTDGSAPTDFVFREVLRLGGHRIVWDSSTSIRLEDSTRPVFFPRGTATVNTDGPRNYEIAPARSARYFIYALRTGDNKWRPHFSRDNTRFEENTADKLLLGYAISNTFGLFTPESIINAVDAGDVNVVSYDGVSQGEELNTTLPVALTNDQDQGVLRLFGKTSTGLFAEAQTHVYDFDTVAPITAIISSFTNEPFSNTLKIEFVTEVGAVVYWSDSVFSPQKVIFGAADRLEDGGQELAVDYSGVTNKVVPNFSTHTVDFKRRNTEGDLLTITTTADVRAGVAILIPPDPTAVLEDFGLTEWDVYVVPDFDNPGKWRFDVGAANVPITETSAAYLVARVTLDIDGVLDIPGGKGSILNATDQDNLSTLARRTRKFLDPILFNAAVTPYRFAITFFAEDSAGNVEEVRTQIFETE